MGIFGDLKASALRRETVSFQALAANFYEGPEGLISLLRDIAQVEHRRGFPLLSAIVLDADTALPPPPVMDMRKELNLRPSQDDKTFWESEI